MGHEFFAEVSEDFIEDDFNLTGLQSQVPMYKEALEMILDVEPEDDDEEEEEEEDEEDEEDALGDDRPAIPESWRSATCPRRQRFERYRELRRTALRTDPPAIHHLAAGHSANAGKI